MFKKVLVDNKIIAFKQSLPQSLDLPNDIHILYPYKVNSAGDQAMTKFYKKYFSDSKTRRIIFNNSPSRLGAGHTGVELTDTKNLEKHCDIAFNGQSSYEISSVFFYHMIEEYGGVDKFYTDFYVGAICPLCLTQTSKAGHEVNATYYETAELQQKLTANIERWISDQLEFNIDQSTAFVLGSGKNDRFFEELNKKHKWFKHVVSLAHPRYIQEYKHKEIPQYIDEYLNAFKSS